MSEDNRISSAAILERMNVNCLVVALTVRRPNGTYKVAGGKVVVGDDNSDATDLTTGARWRLIPAAVEAKLSLLEGQARRAVANVGVQLVKGVYVVPVTRIKALVERLEEVERDFLAEAEQLARDWDTVCYEFFQQIRKKCNGAAEDVIEGLRKKIPNDNDLLGKFGMDLIRFPFGDDGTVHPKAAEALDADIVAQLDHSARRLVENTTMRLFEEPRRELVAAIENVARVAAGGQLRPASVRALRTSYQRMLDFAFLLPEGLRDRLDRVGEVLASPGDLSDSAGRDALIREIRQVEQDLANVSHIESIPVMGADDEDRPLIFDD